MGKSLTERLQDLMKQKKSKSFYAKKLGVTEEEVDTLIQSIRGSKSNSDEQVDFKERFTLSENRDRGTAAFQFEHPYKNCSDETIYKESGFDSDKWKIVTIWLDNKGKDGKYRYSVNFKPRNEDDEEVFQNKFLEHIEKFKSPYKPVKRKPSGHINAAMLLPKQDFHFDKKDTSNNNLIDRRNQDSIATINFVLKASAYYNLEKVFYVIGSDYFNSEFTKATTKGTPQENIGDYHEIFANACDHEIEIIEQMLEEVDEVNVIFVPGNHDYYKCWHLIHWLKAYFKNEPRVKFDIDHSLRKYIKYGDTGVMLHHGNEVRPQMLANIFPKEFKSNWGSCNNFYIVTGDKHREIINDFGNIRHYGVKALSSSKSFWDEQNGYVGQGEATAFVISTDGITDIYKQKTY